MADYQLTATSATHFYLNPKIPEAEEAREQYRERHQETPPLRICKTPYEDPEKEKLRNRFPLKALLKQNPESYKGVRFTTEATITSVNIKRDWFYVSCNRCPLKAKEEDETYRCLDHGKQEKPFYRGFIIDQSATAPITFFTPAADDVTGYSCSQLITKHKAADPQEIPLEIFAIEGQKNIFQIHFNQTGRTVDFILDQVFNKRIKEQGTSTVVQTNPGTSPTPHALTNEQEPDEKTDDQSKSTTVRKSLFSDEPSNPRKQKGTVETSAEDNSKPRNSHKKKSKLT